MKFIKNQKHNSIKITLMAILAIALVIFSISIDLVNEIYQFLLSYVSIPLTHTLVNIVFLIQLLAILFAYRKWWTSNKREQELSKIIDGISPDTLIVTNGLGEIILSNRAAERMFGYSQDELIGLEQTDLISSITKNTDALPDPIESLKNEGFLIGLSKAKSKDGLTFPAEVISTSLQDNGGAAVLIRNITEKVDFQDEIFHYKNRLEEIVAKRTKELRDTKISLIKEIDEHRRSKEEIQNLAQFHESVVDNAKIWMDVIDSEGRVLLWNKAAEEISGYTRDEVVGNDIIWEKLYDKRTSESLKEKVLSAFRNNEEVEIETVIKARNGELKTIVWISRYLRNKKGGNYSALYLGREITQEKIANAQAKKRLEEMKFLSDSSIAFLGISSQKKLFEFLAKGLRKLYPSSKILVNSKNTETMEFVIEAYANIEDIRELLRRKLGKDMIGIGFKLNDDNAIAQLLSSRLVCLQSMGDLNALSFGQIPKTVSEEIKEELNLGNIYTIGFSWDRQLFGSANIITTEQTDIDNADIIESFINQASVALSRIRAEKEMVEAKRIAEKANKAKTQFLANMSHEIRTPLNGLLGMTEITLRSQLNAEQRENIRLAYKSGKDLLKIVNNILDLSKIEAGEMRLAEEEFSLRETVLSLRNKMVVLAKKKVLDFSIEISSDVTDLLIGDAFRLEQVLLNLVSNAIKFTDEGSVRVVIREIKNSDKKKETIKFDIIDTGIGIPKEKMKMIFESYQQADSSTKYKKGTGLGIAIAKSIIILMGGDIEVESEVGIGSDFHFTIVFDLS
ncbi:PAS domain S-box protein [bacterium]|nr:PAS domain S-box protein [bacterium]